MSKKISVIIPCYNAEQFIDVGMQSIYEQDYPDVELIVVNDGSTDGSEGKILAWESRCLERGFLFKYFRQDNQGQAAATSFALKHVTGDYLTLLDADDYFLPGSFRKRADYLDKYPDMAGVRTNGWAVRGESKSLFVTSEREKECTDLFHALFFEGANNWAGSYMVRTEILFDFYSDRSIYLSRFGQNMQIILPVAYKRMFGFINEPLMVYVIHENSHSQADSADKQYEKDNHNFYGYLDIYQHMIQSIVQEPEERAFYENRLNSWLYRHECQNAVRKQDIEALKRNFHALLATEWATLNDKITFYSVLNPVKAVMYKIIRRLKMRKEI